ncbi:MAG: putative transcriptional regulator [Bacteroidetes bacterium]|nr:putative transcriptional regulator [Bacteroidota bacterium]
MSIFFSKQCEYALQAVLYLALKPAGEMTSIKDLAANLGIPYHFVAKILAFTNGCVLGFSECSGKNPCAVHNQWGELRETIYRMLVNKNMSEMARDMKKPEYNLAAS